MKRKILFIGDVNRGSQAGNVRKLSCLFAPVFKQLGVEYSTYISAINELTNPSEWLDSWRDSLRRAEPSSLAQLDLANAAVIGFEVPEWDLAYLTRQNIPWVNVEIHPLRFLDDLYFEITTSFDYDFTPLSASLGLIDLCVNAIRLKYTGGRPISKVPAMAIFGQTPFDKNIFFDGNFKGLDSYFEQIDLLANEHQSIIYRPHPYLTNRDLDHEICRRYNASIITDRNLYKLLASGTFATVCAISSSVVTEAPFFGLRGEFLEPRAKRFGLPISYKKLLDDSSFWLQGLLRLESDTPYMPISQAVPSNFLRDTFSYWGYVTREHEHEERLNTFEVQIQQAEARATLPKASKAQRREGQETAEKPVMVRTGIPPEELVRAAYAALLGREPDEVGFSHHINRLNQTGDIGEILRVFVDSEEFNKRKLREIAPVLVQMVYRGLLGRNADSYGLAAYTEAVKAAGGIDEMLRSIVASDEFRKKIFKVGQRHAPAFTANDLEECKLVFMHIPKTGGTTLHHLLVDAFDKNEVCPERFNGLRHYPAGELVRYRYFSGHFDLPSVRLIPGRKKIITMLREPVARLISLYYFQRAHKLETIERNKLELARLANKYSMAEFFRAEEIRAHPAINNSMTRVLVDTIEGDRWGSKTSNALPDIMQFLPLAVQELEALDAFGILERYDDSVELICKTIGLNIPDKIKPRQVLDVIVYEEPGLRPIDKEPVTDEIRHLIEDLVQADMELYSHARAVFEERLATLRKR